MSDRSDGFKAGLEIHQQLSGTKLFCACPAEIREDEPDFTLTRSLRASQGESGEVDVAAAHAQSKQKYYVYQGYHESTCLVECDEEPVSAPSPRAVETAAMVSRMLGMTFVDEVHVMRKAVVDGSNTSGFQRTMLVSLNGTIHDVRIDRLCLEEDSCKVVSRNQDHDIYNLSRLGIPLLEITTLPDITSPEHLKETASALGMVLRSTGRVRRGLGTIRQDVNISVAGGSRVEIKGVQDLDGMPVLAENEASRQKALIALAQELSTAVCSSPVDVSEHFSEGWVSQALSREEHAVGVRVTGWSGVFGKELFGGYRVGTELAGYANAWGFGGIIHSDEDSEKYGLSSWEGVRRALSCSEGDGCFLLVGKSERITDCIAIALIPRLEQFTVGVPSEVRKDNGDGTTRYLRPMPGAARMYPETDVRTFDISSVEIEVPELLSVRIPKIAQRYSLDEGLVSELIRHDRLEVFEQWAKSLPASLVADVLVVREKDLKRRHGVDVDVLGVVDELFSRIHTNEASKDAVDDILLQFAKNGRVDWAFFTPVDESALKAIIADIVSNDPDAPFGALMGQAMKAVAGKADGKTVSRLLKEAMQ